MFILLSISILFFGYVR